MKFTDKISGYSGTPLVKKLGIKEGCNCAVNNAPEGFFDLLGELPSAVTISNKLSGHFDYIHFFTLNKNELTKKFPLLKKALNKNGMLWISWLKRSSKLQSDLTEDIIRNIALKNGLVDIKVCAIDDLWSGLKLVYRLKDR
jgi:hypothetical protein